MNGELKILPKKRNESAIDYAKELLQKCESGEVVAVTAVEEGGDGTYTVQGSSCASKTKMAGMLLHAAIDRLGDD